MDYKDKLTILFVSICMGVLGIITEYFFGKETVVFLIPVSLQVISFVGIFTSLAELYNYIEKPHITYAISFLQILIGTIGYILSLCCIKLGVFSLMCIIFTVASIILNIWYLCIWIYMISRKE